jgi:glutathione S-transferase
LADIVIFPFIRQFASVDSSWFDAAAYPKLKAWLIMLVESTLFKRMMKNSPLMLNKWAVSTGV